MWHKSPIEYHFVSLNFGRFSYAKQGFAPLNFGLHFYIDFATQNLFFLMVAKSLFCEAPHPPPFLTVFLRKTPKTTTPMPYGDGGPAYDPTPQAGVGGLPQGLPENWVYEILWEWGPLWSFLFATLIKKQGEGCPVLLLYHFPLLKSPFIITDLKINSPPT